MKNKIKLFLILTILSIGLTSCGLYEDFVTYFNTYYNTKELFDEAMLEVLPSEKELFNPNPQPVQSGSQKFTTVIEKCSKILQYNSTSSFVDNALYMIGISYYYQKEYPSAIRKFSELITNLPNSKYVLEAKLWIAKCNSKMNETKKAEKILLDLIQEATEKDEEDIIADSYLELTKIAYSENNLDKVILYGQKYIENKNDNEKASQVMLEIGVSQYQQKKYSEALNSLNKVDKFSPTYKTTFRAELYKAKVLREMRKYDEALDIVEDLLDNQLNEEFTDQIRLERGNIYLAKGNLEDAIQEYKFVDTVYSRTESGGMAQLKIADYLENNLNNLDSAKYYYDRAATSAAPKELLTFAQRKAQILTKRKTLNDNITKTYERIERLRIFPYDSTNLPGKEVIIDSTRLDDSVYMANIEVELRQKKIVDSLYFDRLRKDTLQYQTNLIIADSIKFDIAKFTYDLALIYLTELELPDSSISYFKFVIDSFPKTDLAIRSSYALANIYLNKGLVQLSDSIFNSILEIDNKSEIAKAISKRMNKPVAADSSEIIKNEFLKAENLMKEKKYDLAIEKLSYIVQNFFNNEYAPKSLLTIGYIYENYLKNFEKASVYYDSLNKSFPSTKYAASITAKLNAYKEHIATLEAQKKAEEERKKAEEEAKKKGKEIVNQNKTPEDSLEILKKEEELRKEKELKELENQPQPEDNPDKKEEIEREKISSIIINRRYIFNN